MCIAWLFFNLANDIDESVFKTFTEAQLKELIPSLGHRTKFGNNYFSEREKLFVTFKNEPSTSQGGHRVFEQENSDPNVTLEVEEYFIESTALSASNLEDILDSSGAFVPDISASSHAKVALNGL